MELIYAKGEELYKLMVEVLFMCLKNDVATFVMNSEECGCLFPPGLVNLPPFFNIMEPIFAYNISQIELVDYSDYVFAPLGSGCGNVNEENNQDIINGIECPEECPDCIVEILSQETGCPQFNIICPGQEEEVDGPYDAGPTDRCACELENGFTIVEYCGVLSCEIISEEFSLTDGGLDLCSEVFGGLNCLCDNDIPVSEGEEEFEICVCEDEFGYQLQYHEPGNDCFVYYTGPFYSYPDHGIFPGTFAYPKMFRRLSTT